jgi:predicted MPP superfamily phosphohydrolase
MSIQLITVIVLISVAIISYFLLIFPTQWLKIERIQHLCGIGIRVLQISDLHVEKNRISPRRLNRIIREENLDYIFLTGDYTEKPRYLAKVERYIEAISSVGIPVYAVLGNHDHRLKLDKLEQMLRVFKKNGVHLLDNEAVKCGSFQLVGIDDLSSNKSKIEKAFEKVDNDPTIPTIIITHDPNIVLHIDREFTYFMAGHFHGMQFKVPFMYKFIKKGKLARDGITEGLHRSAHGPYYISKGIGQAGFNARLFIRSEVTIHEL